VRLENPLGHGDFVSGLILSGERDGRLGLARSSVVCPLGGHMCANGLLWYGRSYAGITDRKPSTRAALVCLSCFVAWGFGFCHAGLWARPRPGALGGALVMPRKIWSGPVLPVCSEVF
jgi:hypothetical protein